MDVAGIDKSLRMYKILYLPNLPGQKTEIQQTAEIWTDFQSQLLNPPIKCTATWQRQEPWGSLAPNRYGQELVAVTWPKSNTQVFRALPDVLAIAACRCGWLIATVSISCLLFLGKSYLNKLFLPCQAWDKQVNPRAQKLHKCLHVILNQFQVVQTWVFFLAFTSNTECAWKCLSMSASGETSIIKDEVSLWNLA